MKFIDLNNPMTRDIDIKKAQSGDLVKWYNENSGTKALVKFKDRATAEKRCAELKQAINELSGKSSKKAAAAPKEKKVKAPKGESNPAENRGRNSSYASKKIYKKTEENPRRENTHGHKSFSVIKNGMTFEDYIAAGGRANDLRWDLERGHLELK